MQLIQYSSKVRLYFSKRRVPLEDYTVPITPPPFHQLYPVVYHPDENFDVFSQLKTNKRDVK